MKRLRYTLAVLTHGTGPTLTESLESFNACVSPAPDEFVLHRDPGDGFCVATHALWDKAILAGNDYVFWLEHDFVILRPVDLNQLAAVLNSDPRLSQVALMRDAVSEPEKKAGGLFESRQGATRWDREEWGYTQTDYVLTTNPSLMRTQFMAANPWPDYPAECEGRFGIDLRERGFVAGVWGDGSPWVRHIGIRDGHGY